MTSIIETKGFDFHGNILRSVKRDGKVWVVLKDLCDALGVDYSAQLKKVKQMPGTRMAVIAMQVESENGVIQDRDLTCIDSRTLYTWLCSIHPSRIRPEFREKLTVYQRECADALEAYWNDGVAVNPRAGLVSGEKGLLRLQAEQILAITIQQEELEAQQKAQEKAISEIKPGLAKVKERLDAIETSQNYFTIKGWLIYRNLGSRPNEVVSQMGARATRHSRLAGVSLGTAPDPVWGRVNTYPLSLLDNVFEDLAA